MTGFTVTLWLEARLVATRRHRGPTVVFRARFGRLTACDGILT